MWEIAKPGKRIKEVLKQLGPEYSIRVIDFEQCIYRNFGNGFDIEVSGVNTQKRKNLRCDIYLWYRTGDRYNTGHIVQCDQNVPFDEIGTVVDRLYRNTQNNKKSLDEMLECRWNHVKMF